MFESQHQICFILPIYMTNVVNLVKLSIPLFTLHHQSGEIKNHAVAPNYMGKKDEEENWIAV